MTIPKINSAHGSETRNIINAAIDLINAQGKSIQDLVAEGQLTPTQYATLINVVNGNVKKGEVSIHDIDKNKGKFDQTYLTQDLLDAITGSPGANILSEVAPNSVTNDKLANQSVTAEKTDFLMNNESNLFNGFINAVFTYEGSKGPNRIFFLTSKYDDPSPHNGSLVIFPLKHNTTYSITFHDAHNQFRLAKVVNYPEIPQGYDRYIINPSDVLVDDAGLNTFNFNSGSSKFGILYASSIGQKPRIQINEGANSSVYRNPYALKSEFLDDEMVRRKVSNIVFEDAKDGYPERPDFPSVIYYGVNEPTDVEPFDEWREMEGYTYYRDFKNRLMNDFISPDEEVTLSFHMDQGTPAMRIDNPAMEATLVYWEDVSGDKKMETQEIFLEARNASMSVRGPSTLHMFNDGVDGPEYYAIGLTADGRFRLNRVSPNSETITQDFWIDIDVSKPFKIRSRVESGVIRAKTWQSDQEEPKEWHLEYVDSNPITGNEKAGIYTFGYDHLLYKIGVSTGGMTAPKRKWW